MSEELEVEVQELQERVREAVERLDKESSREQGREDRERRWFSQVALSAGIFSALAAIAAMQGNWLANEGMLSQIHANDQWGLYQSKSTKRHIEQGTETILESLHKPVPVDIDDELQRLRKDQLDSEGTARRLERAAGEDLERHESYALSVAAFQIAISLCAVAALLKRPAVWYLSLGLAAVGLMLMAMGAFPVVHASNLWDWILRNPGQQLISTY